MRCDGELAALQCIKMRCTPCICRRCSQCTPLTYVCCCCAISTVTSFCPITAVILETLSSLHAPPRTSSPRIAALRRRPFSVLHAAAMRPLTEEETKIFFEKLAKLSAA